MNLQKELVRKDPASVLFKNDLGTSYYNMAMAADGKSQSDWLRQALQIRRDLVKLEPTNVLFRRNLARTSNLLGFHEIALGHIEDGLNAHRESCRLLEQVVREVPQVNSYHGDLADSQNSLGTALGTLGRHKEARIEFEKAQVILRRLIHTNPNDKGYQNILGMVDANIAEADQALAQAQATNGATGAPAAKPDGKEASRKIGTSESILKNAPPR